MESNSGGAPSRVLACGAIMLAAALCGCSDFRRDYKSTIVRACADGGYVMRRTDGALVLRGLLYWDASIDTPIAKDADLDQVCPLSKSKDGAPLLKRPTHD